MDLWNFVNSELATVHDDFLKGEEENDFGVLILMIIVRVTNSVWLAFLETLHDDVKDFCGLI